MHPFLINAGFFAFGLLGILGHILLKLKHEGKRRFVFVWRYIVDNQIPFAFSIFTYLAIYILWTNGMLSKWFPIMLFEMKLGWGSLVIAYFADSVWRNIIKDVDSALERKRNGG